MSKIKIGFFCGFFPVISGGAEYQTFMLSKCLDPKKFDVFFLALDENIEGFHEMNGIKVYFFKSKGPFGKLFDAGYFSNYKYIKSVLCEENPHVIFQLMANSATGILQYLSKKLSYKFVWTCASDSDLWPIQIISIHEILKIPEYILKRRGIRKADLVLSQTEYQKQRLEKQFHCEAKILRNLHPVPMELTEKNTDTIKILWIANLKKLKQPELFIELASRFQNSKNVEFIMIGRPGLGEWQADIEAKIRQLGNLKYIGELTQEETNKNLDQAHILVNTSQYEGFSNTFIQAWLRKVPVVSLNSDPDCLLSKGGMGFRSGDFQTLLFDVQKLIENNFLRNSMGQKARDYSCENHSIEKVGKQFVYMINRLCNR